MDHIQEFLENLIIINTHITLVKPILLNFQVRC